MVSFHHILAAGVGLVLLFGVVTFYSHSLLEVGHTRISFGHYFSNRFIRNRFKVAGDADVSTTGSLAVSSRPRIPIPGVRKAAVRNDPRAINRHYVGPVVNGQLGRMPNCSYAGLVGYWKEPTMSDIDYEPPFPSSDGDGGARYLTFEPDVGGWNNVRMQMEIVLVLAMTTGRTLVLPPEQHMYLMLAGDREQKAHSFADFFDFDFISTRVRVMSMEAFLAKEGVTGHLTRYNNVTDSREVELPPENRTAFDNTRREEKLKIWGYLRRVGTALGVRNGMKEYLTVPQSPAASLSSGESQRMRTRARKEKFAAARTERVYDSGLQAAKLIHIATRVELNERLMLHFYTFLFFEDEAVQRLVNRFVRDYVHYTDEVVCKAALVINALFREAAGRGFSAFHIRRGDLQYKEVKVSADVLLANVGHLLPRNELVYIASDEQNKSFFDPFRARFPTVRFLGDYWDKADLGSANPNILGMIDALICARGTTFVGTWFSTFTGYITRVRGYMGYSDRSVYLGDKVHRDRYQRDEDPRFPFYMREYNVSWDHIDD